MNNNCKALNNFSRQSLSAKFVIAFVSALINSLKRNANFPGLDAMLDELGTALTEFMQKWTIAQTGSAAQKAEAHTLKLNVQQLIKPIWQKVNFIADGSRDKLLTTSFKLSKDTRTLLVLGPIEKFKVEQGTNAGELIPSFKKQAGIKGTTFQYTYDETPTADSKWESKTSSRVSCVLSGLEPGWVVNLRVIITGARNQTIISNPIKTVVGFAKQ